MYPPVCIVLYSYTFTKEYKVVNVFAFIAWRAREKLFGLNMKNTDMMVTTGINTYSKKKQKYTNV